MSKMSLATHLRDRVIEMGVSNSEIAKRAHISRQTWYKLLNADIEEARLSTLMRVASALDTHIVDLLKFYYADHCFSHASKKTEHTVKFSSGFVADITYPMNSNVLVGETFTKTWRVANIGRKNWENLRLNCLDDQTEEITPYLLQPTSKEVLIPDTKSGEVVNVSVTFKAPLTAGTVISEWEPMRDGQSLGNESLSILRCIVKVISV